MQSLRYRLSVMDIRKNCEQAKEILERGGLVAVPTETVYGLAGLIDSPEAIRAIFELKGRPLYDPLIVHIGARAQLAALTDFRSEAITRLTESFWPGPLTVVVPKRSSVDDLITAGLESVGVRMPRHPVALELLGMLRAPFAAPSANRFKHTSPTASDHVRSEFPGTDLFVLEGGECDVGIESTVIECTERSKLRILRPGVITREMIKQKLEGLDVQISVEESGASPGHMAEHYMPSLPLVVVNRAPSAALHEKILRELSLGGGVGAEIVLDDSPLIAARDLYRQMRAERGTNVSYLYVLRGDNQVGELWDAVWNRLGKAATVKSIVTI